jgi:hypothetical protein
VAAAPWTTPDLKRRCVELREDLAQGGAASAEELAAYWPGGAENTYGGRGGWIYCYSQLSRFVARLERRAPGSDASIARDDARVLAALRGAPVAVTALGPRADGTAWQVHPKSFEALLYLHALDAQLGYALAAKQRFDAALLAGLLDAATAAQLPTIAATVSELQLLCCWIVTTPGPGVPEGARALEPAIPAELRALDAVAILALVRAHQQLLGRAHVVRALIDEATEHESGQRPSWSLFLGSLAVEWGEDAGVLARQRTLESLLATARLGAAARRPPETD